MARHVSRTLTTAALLLCLAPGAEAGINAWTSNGPPGPFGDLVNALAIDPAVPTTLYAATAGGVFKSTDGGASWFAVNAGLTNTIADALAIDPTVPSTLYVGSFPGVFKSTDGGANWSDASAGLGFTNVRALAIDPTVPTTLYVGTPGGGLLFKSTDSGASWNAANAGLLATEVRALAIDPTASTTLYAGTFSGVFKSTDGGSSWSAVNTGLTNNGVFALAMDPTDPNTLYAGTNGGVFKSTDGGASWNVGNAGLTNVSIRALAVDPAIPTTLHTGPNVGGVFKSTDGGASWSAINGGLTNINVRALAIDPTVPTTLYAATAGGGVFELTQAAAITPSKEVQGDFTPGGTILYVVTLNNDGLADQSDNPGDELVDTLPAMLTLVDATVMAGAGSLAADPATNTVTWNGPIPASGGVVIQIEATIDLGTVGQTVSNQGDLAFDGDSDGVNETQTVTDDPGVGGIDDPTSFEVSASAAIEIPTLDPAGLAFLALVLATGAWVGLRRSSGS